MHHNGNDDEVKPIVQRSIAELKAERTTEPPIEESTAEDEFLAKLFANLKRPSYTVSVEETKELKRIALLDGEAVCDYLVRELRPQPDPSPYVSKRNYYVIPGIMAISLETGRYFSGGKNEGKQDGIGDIIETWSLFKRVNFYGAVYGLTEFLIRLREQKARHRASLCVPGVAIVELKQLLWQVFEDKGLVAEGKILFPRRHRGKAERTAWISAGGLWQIVYEVYGELCLSSKYFASAYKFRELLDLFSDPGDPGRFRTRRRWSPKHVNLRDARRVEFAFEPTDYPLDLPPAPELQ